MINLIRKDLMLLRGIAPTWISAYVIFLLVNSSSPVMRMIPVFMAFFLLALALALDDRYGLDPLYCSLPLKRSTIVSARYLFSFLILFISLLATWLASLALPGAPLSLRSVLGAFAAGAFFLVLFFPLNYRFGFRLESEPFKILGALLLVAGGFFGLAWLILRAGAWLRRVHFLEVYVLLLLVVAAILSLLLSIAFFRRREW